MHTRRIDLGKMSNMASRRNGPADGVIYMINTFRGGEEGFNGLRSIKTDIYYEPGWVCFAASFIL